MKVHFLAAVMRVCLMTPATNSAHYPHRKSQLSLYSSKKVNQKIIMKVLFLVAAIAVCLMTFAPATEASYHPGQRCCVYKYRNRCRTVHYRRVCNKVKAGCLHYCPYKG
ncbi:hypothetical protein EB796_006333 [Bugula neritina]|uniref:Uncharacterized protein n=1 Tax=Bugula neritina TaxID=10212 RepID=A0A7J7KAS9_BUGNE|nr:hypothetical protein EB796_006333 [Bugula neritina]